MIAGNHESSFDRHFYASYWHHYGHKQQYDPDEVRALLTNALYLEDEAVEIEGYVFYGYYLVWIQSFVAHLPAQSNLVVLTIYLSSSCCV